MRLLIAIAATILFSAPVAAFTINQNFDDQQIGSICGGWDAGAGSKVQSLNGANVCKLTVPQGSTAFGVWGGIIPHPVKIRRYGEIWFKLRTFFPTGFNYDSTAEGNRLKFLRIHTMSDSVANYGYNDLYINPKGFREPFSFIYEGEQVWGTISNLSHVISLGVWETYEMYVKLDTVPVSRGGQAIVRIWKNGVLLGELKDRLTLAAPDAYSDRSHLFTYWNGGSPITQSMYIDDLVLTSDTPTGRDAAGNPYVGAGSGAAPLQIAPKPPEYLCRCVIESP